MGNDQIEFVFGKDNGEVTQVHDKATDETFLQTRRAGSLWNLTLYHPEHDHLGTHSGIARQVTFGKEQKDAIARLRIEHTDGELHGDAGRIGELFAGPVCIDVTVRRGDALAYWTVHVRNDSKWAIREIQAPTIRGIEALEKDSSDAVYMPRHLGRKYPDPTSSEGLGRMRYPSSWGTMQFTAYLGDDTGLYAAALDSDGYMKGLEFHAAAGNELDFVARHLRPYQIGQDVTIPYKTAVGIHRGSWMDACDRYRTWVETEGWLQEKESMVPDRLRTRGLTYSQRSYHRKKHDAPRVNATFDEVRKILSKLRDRVSVPIGFFWGGWQKHGSRAGGDFWPPYEGVEKFSEVVAALRGQGVGTQCFFNPTVISPVSDYWQSLDNPERLVIKDRDGDLVRRSVGPYTVYDVEPVLPEWRDHYVAALHNLMAAGIRHIELDGVPHQWHACWNEDHGHPVGIGGNWYQQALRDLMVALHSAFDGEDHLIVSGERIADFYLPYMNNYLTRDAHARMRSDEYEIIPMFPYTFGDYAVARNGEGHLSAGDRDVQREIAGRTIAWNTAPWVEGDPSPPNVDSHVLAYNTRLARARATYLKRFFAGQMLPGPVLDTEEITIRAGDTSVTTDEILRSAWRSDRGELGIALTNVSNRAGEISVSLAWAEQPFSLEHNSSLIYTVVNGDYTIETRSTDALGTVDVSLAPAEVGLIVATESDESRVEALEAITTAQNDSDADEEQVADAKRAFEARAFGEAVQLANAAVTSEDDTTSGASPTPTESVEHMGGEQPGLGFISALAGIGGLGYALKRRLERGANDED